MSVLARQINTVVKTLNVTIVMKITLNIIVKNAKYICAPNATLICIKKGPVLDIFEIKRINDFVGTVRHVDLVFVTNVLMRMVFIENIIIYYVLQLWMTSRRK